MTYFVSSGTSNLICLLDHRFFNLAYHMHNMDVWWNVVWYMAIDMHEMLLVVSDKELMNCMLCGNNLLIRVIAKVHFCFVFSLNWLSLAWVFIVFCFETCLNSCTPGNCKSFCQILWLSLLSFAIQKSRIWIIFPQFVISGVCCIVLPVCMNTAVVGTTPNDH